MTHTATMDETAIMEIDFETFRSAFSDTLRPEYVDLDLKLMRYSWRDGDLLKEYERHANRVIREYGLKLSVVPETWHQYGKLREAALIIEFDPSKL